MERHRVDPVSFVFGALFSVVALLGLTPLVTIGVADLRWMLPTAIVLLGLALVLSAAATGRDRGGRATVPDGDHHLGDHHLDDRRVDDRHLDDRGRDEGARDGWGVDDHQASGGSARAGSTETQVVEDPDGEVRGDR